MKFSKQVVERYRPGSVIVAPSIFNGVLAGSLFALFLPSVVSVGSLLLARLASYRKDHLPSNPWFQALVRPEHLLTLVVVAAISAVFIRRSSLMALLRRCRSAIAYDASVIWAACTFFAWVEPHLPARLLFVLAGLLITAAVVGLRTPFSVDSDALVKVDRPITAFSEDKLERKPLILSLMKRLISDGAPVIALIGAYGDGKTSILNLLATNSKARRR